MPESVLKTKILLFAHQCAACPQTEATLRYMEFLSFTHNCTSILQLLDQGKLRSLKHYYHQQLVRNAVSMVDYK